MKTVVSAPCLNLLSAESIGAYIKAYAPNLINKFGAYVVMSILTRFAVLFGELVGVHCNHKLLVGRNDADGNFAVGG